MNRSRTLLIISVLLGTFVASGCEILFVDPSNAKYGFGDGGGETPDDARDSPSDGTADSAQSSDVTSDGDVRTTDTDDGGASDSDTGEVVDARDTGDGMDDSTALDGDTSDNDGPRAVSVCTGQEHSCALVSDGHSNDRDVVCWGDFRDQFSYDSRAGSCKQNGSTIGQEWKPKKLFGTRDVLDVACGRDHTCAVVETSTDSSDYGVECWGSDGEGQLGNGMSRNDETMPARVSDPESRTIGASANYKDTLTLVAGLAHTCLVQITGVFCWGRWRFGGETPKKTETPTPVQTSKGFEQLDAGRDYTCGVYNQKVWCWGKSHDELFGSSGDSASPIDIGLADPAPRTVRTGLDHACAIGDGNSTLLCWGANKGHHLGGPVVGPTDPEIRTFDDPLTGVAAGEDHTCLVHDEGPTHCFGENDYGQLGATPGTNLWTEPKSTDNNRLKDLKIRDGLDDPDHRNIDALTHHTCAVLESGNVACWGRNRCGEVGKAPDNGEKVSTPVKVNFPAQ